MRLLGCFAGFLVFAMGVMSNNFIFGCIGAAVFAIAAGCSREK